MYELPSRSDVKGCVVDADTVNEGVQPSLVRTGRDQGTSPGDCNGQDAACSCVEVR